MCTVFVSRLPWSHFRGAFVDRDPMFVYFPAYSKGEKALLVLDDVLFYLLEVAESFVLP